MRFSKLFASAVLLATSTFAYGAPVSDKSQVLTAENFDKETAQGIWVVKHYSTKCSHCISFQPKWEKVVSQRAVELYEKGVHFGEVNCLEEPELCGKNGATSWPFVASFKNGKKVDHMVGDRPDSVLDSFVKRQIRPEFDSNSVVMDASNFTQTISQGVWLIKHYSPTCSHCKAMAPAWIKMSDELSEQMRGSDVHFGEINCKKDWEFCKVNHVNGFPTINLFYYGKYIEEMNSNPTYQNLRAYAFTIPNRMEAGDFDKSPAQSENKDNDLEWDDVVEDKKGDVAAKPDAEKDANKEDSGSSSDVDEYDGSEDSEDSDGALAAEENKRGGLVGADSNSSGEVVVLTKSNFAELTSNGAWFVKFYAPWCPHCQHLAPVWEEVAKALKGKVNVGKVNCDEAGHLCSKYNVQGYPTLKLLWGSETVEFKGERNLDSFVRFVDGVMVEPQNVDAIDELRRAREERDVLFVFAYDKKDTSAKTKNALMRTKGNAQKLFLANSMSIVSDIHVARSLIPGEDPKLPLLVALKDNQAVKFEGSLTNDDQLREWFYAERFPLLPQLDRQNSDDLFYDSDFLILAILDSNRGDEYMAHYKEAVRGAALEYQSKYEATGKRTKGSVRFAWVDGEKWAAYVDRVFKIRRTDWPAVVIAQPSEDQYYITGTNGAPIEFTKPAIFDAIKAALGGTLTPHSTSSILIRAVRGAVSTVSAVGGFFFGSTLRAIITLLGMAALGYYLIKKSSGRRTNAYEGILKAD